MHRQVRLRLVSASTDGWLTSLGHRPRCIPPIPYSLLPLSLRNRAIPRIWGRNKKTQALTSQSLRQAPSTLDCLAPLLMASNPRVVFHGLGGQGDCPWHDCKANSNSLTTAAKFNKVPICRASASLAFSKAEEEAAVRRLLAFPRSSMQPWLQSCTRCTHSAGRVL